MGVLTACAAVGMGLFAIVLSGCTLSFAAAATALTLIGFFGGLVVVPLNAMLQQRSDPREIGRVMATNNFLNMVAILLASGALWVCSDHLTLSSDRVVLTSASSRWRRPSELCGSCPSCGRHESWLVS